MRDDYLSAAMGVVCGSLLSLRLVQQIPVAAPAAGAEFVTLVPGGSMWELLAIDYNFTASAFVANRIPRLVVQDADQTIRARLLTTGAVTAGQTIEFGWFAGLGDNNETQGRNHSLPSPPMILQPGWRIRSNTIAIDAGDQYSAITVTVRQWSEAEAVQEMVEIVEQLDSFTQRLVR